jgi:hypothetical protein
MGKLLLPSDRGLVNPQLRTRRASRRMVYDDYPDAFIPELWANESIAILVENMVIGSLVHRDFQPIIASYGDVVNTRKPGNFKAQRKSASDQVVVQTPTATNVAVRLNQHFHTSFLIPDPHMSLSFINLIVEYLSPAMLSIARAIDQVLLAQVYQFLPNCAGELGGITNSNADDFLLDTREVMNTNKAYVENRRLILGTVSETALLKDTMFTQAYSVGDQGYAMREAALGRKFGFDIYMSQNTPYVPIGAGVTTGAVNNVSGYLSGANTLTIDGFSAAIANNAWIAIDGVPYQVTSTTGGATPTAVVLNQPLIAPALDNAVVTYYTPGAINEPTPPAGSISTTGYDQWYDKYLTFDSFTGTGPQIGQGVTFGNVPGTDVYGVIDVVGNTFMLDRPIEVAIPDNTPINLLPPGSYNFAFHRNALTLVCRPLALPPPGTGARAGVANYNDISMRIVMTYDGHAQGTLITCPRSGSRCGYARMIQNWGLF